jgi:hypothetical protein
VVAGKPHPHLKRMVGVRGNEQKPVFKGGHPVGIGPAILGEKINPLNSHSHQPFQSFFSQPQYRGNGINILI